MINFIAKQEEIEMMQTRIKSEEERVSVLESELEAKDATLKDTMLAKQAIQTEKVSFSEHEG